MQACEDGSGIVTADVCPAVAWLSRAGRGQARQSNAQVANRRCEEEEEMGRKRRLVVDAQDLRDDLMVSIVSARRAKRKCRMVQTAANLDGHQDPEEDVVVWECTVEYMAEADRVFDLADAVASNPFIWPGPMSPGERARLAYDFRSPVEAERVVL